MGVGRSKMTNLLNPDSFSIYPKPSFTMEFIKELVDVKDEEGPCNFEDFNLVSFNVLIFPSLLGA